MIGTKPKNSEAVKGMIAPFKSFYLIGCGDCATLCKTGGENEVKDFAAYLEKNGKTVAGFAVLEEACDLRLAKKLFRQDADKIKKAECVLVFACGSGVQTAAECTDKQVLPMLDSIFAGGTENLSKFRELCSVCGDCILDLTAGICPITRCPKGLVNGPCGGSNNGKCEETPELDCAWHLILKKLKSNGRIGELKNAVRIKSYKNASKPRKIENKR